MASVGLVNEPIGQGLRPFSPRWARRLEPNPEWAIVILLVAAAVLSAIAFWQATRFADLSTDLANQARFAAAQQSQSQSAFWATIRHDRHVVVDCLAAVSSRDAGLAEYSGSFRDDALATVVAAEQTRIALQPLLINTPECGTLDVERALEYERFAGTDRLAGGDWQTLLVRSARASSGETLAMTSAVLFAVTLLLLTLADSSLRPSLIRIWMGLAVLVCVGAAAVAAMAFWAAGDFPVGAMALFLGFLVLVLVSGRAFAVGSPHWFARAANPRASRMLTFLTPIAARLNRRVRWWAEIFGALTLVLFALAALGFSHSANVERTVTVDADRLTVEARQALELGQQSATAALDHVARLAELDARLAASTRFSPGSVSAHSEARSAVRESWREETDAHDDLLTALRGGGIEAGSDAHGGLQTAPNTCLGDDDIFVWSEPGAETAAPLPELLMAGLRTDPDTPFDLIQRAGAAGLRCSAAAAITWKLAERWGEHASLFTVALVILGLAGFLFALAADPDRSMRPRRWLLLAGIVGFGTGLTVTALAAVTPRPTTAAEIAAASAGYAESLQASAQGDCAGAVNAARAAVQSAGDFGPAHAALADAWACTDRDWLLTPRIEQLDAYRKSLETAIDLGMSDSATIGNLGWAYLLSAVGSEDGPRRTDQLREASRLTEQALLEDPSSPFLCFNFAFAALAEGDASLATERYEAALAALDRRETPNAPCTPVDFSDEGLVDWMKLVAIADLELLPDDQAQPFRNLILGTEAPLVAEDVRAPEASLRWYPQEIVIEGTSLPDAFSVVWYYRSDPDAAWGVLPNPSQWTLVPGNHAGVWRVDRALPSGEYRADIYMGDTLLRVVEPYETLWGTTNLDPEDFEWVQAPDLGISVVVPEEWELISHDPGITMIWGSQGGRVALHRSEGTTRAAMEDEFHTWLDSLLGSWGVESDVWTQTATEDWFLDLSTWSARHAESGVWAGAGHQQYLVPDEDVDLPLRPEEVEHESCPGTTLMMVVQAHDPAVADAVWRSKVALTPLNTTTVGEISLQGAFQSRSFGVEIPDGWTASACPDYFFGLAGDGSAFAYVDAFESSLSLKEWSAAVVESFETPEDLERLMLPNDVPADLVGYAETFEGVTWETNLVTAVMDGRAYLLYLSAVEGSSAREDLTVIRDSFTPGAP